MTAARRFASPLSLTAIDLVWITLITVIVSVAPGPYGKRDEFQISLMALRIVTLAGVVWLLLFARR